MEQTIPQSKRYPIFSKFHLPLGSCSFNICCPKSKPLPIRANYQQNLFPNSITKKDFQGIQKFSRWSYLLRNISYFLSLDWCRLCNYLIKAKQLGGVHHIEKENSGGRNSSWVATPWHLSNANFILLKKKTHWGYK